MRCILFILLSAFFLTSCTKEYENIEPNIYLDLSNSNGVFIGCEGNFMYGNASLSYYDKDTKKYYNQIFFNTNNFPLGDVLQSTKIIEDKLYLSVNNSGKILIVDIDNMLFHSKISGLVSPRYIEVIEGDKAYVTDLYSPTIAVLDLKTQDVQKGVFIGYSPTGKPRGTEEMVRYKDFIYTCSWSFGNQLYKIDTKLDLVVDSLTVTKQPNSLVLDKNNKLWVLSDGGYVGTPYGKVNAALSCINAETFEVERVFTFDSKTVQPSRLRISPDKESLYYVYGRSNSHSSVVNLDYGVYKMSINENSLPKKPYINAEGKLIYSLGIDSNNGDLYIGDAIDYVQKGIVYRYSKDGIEIDKFPTGIIPGSFTFKEGSNN